MAAKGGGRWVGARRRRGTATGQEEDHNEEESKAGYTEAIVLSIPVLVFQIGLAKHNFWVYHIPYMI